MQGLESLNQFKKFVSSLGGLGRFEDTYMVHAAEGETVVPMEVLDRNPVLKKRLFKSMKALGIDPGRYIVGNDLNSLNPVTGQPEFFFKRLKKALGDIAGYAAPIVGAMYGPGVGAMVGAGLGAFKRENPGDPSQWAQMAGLGGLSGLAANVASGNPNMFTGRGARDIYRKGNPFELGRAFFDDPGKMWDPKYDFLKVKEKETASQINDKVGIEANRLANTHGGEVSDWISTAQSNVSKDTGIPMAKIIKWGLALGALEKFTTGDQNVGDKYEYAQTGDIYDPVLNPQLTYSAEGGIIGYNGGGFTGSPHTEGPFYKGEDEGSSMPEAMKEELLKYLLHKFMQEQEYIRERNEDPYNQYRDPNAPIEVARGGVMDLQGGGESIGPGTGTSDSIPAMLSDGEFVMTADAVRGAGGGDRREGAKRMYEAMDRLEARV